MIYLLNLKEKIHKTNYVSNRNDEFIAAVGAAKNGHKILQIIDKKSIENNIVFDILAIKDRKVVKCVYNVIIDQDVIKPKSFLCE